MTIRASRSAALLAVLIAGCSAGFDPEIEDMVGIDEGVYGQLSRGCDISGCNI